MIYVSLLHITKQMLLHNAEINHNTWTRMTRRIVLLIADLFRAECRHTDSDIAYISSLYDGN